MVHTGMHPPALRWPLEAIWQAVEPTLPGFTAELLPCIDSTNSELLRRLRGDSGAEARPEPTLLVAERQTAGRGRHGRQWHSSAATPGASLTFSLALPLAPADWSGLSLVAGISIADSLEPLAAGATPAIGLKWPNDLWLRGAGGERKLAGILVETASVGSQRFAVVGVGINIAPPTGGLTLEAGASAAVPPGFLSELDPALDAPGALLAIAAPLAGALAAFAQFGFDPFRSRFARRDLLEGRLLALSDGSSGTGCGVAENGALLVHTAGGMQHITSSDISVRPAPGACAPAGSPGSVPNPAAC
jgi:BirA family transcriptional regulator, biotin operon repressor / biotin---[acetyl-CoA-carboxylase] ligase